MLLKASLSHKENVLLRAWQRGYEMAFAPCYPRLHVITDESNVAQAKSIFKSTPNATVRANALAPLLAAEAARGNPYPLVQWHILWADNFTNAEYLFFLDVDAVPVMPLRCHHVFDDLERLRVFAFHYTPPVSPWIPIDSAVFRNAIEERDAIPEEDTRRRLRRKAFSATMANLDFMALWPIVAPRWVLPHLRRLVVQYHRPHGAAFFDEAYTMAPTAPARPPFLRDSERYGYSHSDLLGKALILLFPERIHPALCPGTVNRSASAVLTELETFRTDVQANLPEARRQNRARGARKELFECRDRVNPIEHVRHPLQNLHSLAIHVKYKNMASAADFAHGLINASLRFFDSGGPIPPQLFQYGTRPALPYELRRPADVEAGIATWLRREQPGRVCGVSNRPAPAER